MINRYVVIKNVAMLVLRDMQNIKERATTWTQPILIISPTSYNMIIIGSSSHSSTDYNNCNAMSAIIGRLAQHRRRRRVRTMTIPRHTHLKYCTFLRNNPAQDSLMQTLIIAYNSAYRNFRNERLHLYT